MGAPTAGASPPGAVAPLYEAAAREELSRPPRLDDAAELSWYFVQQRGVERGGDILVILASDEVDSRVAKLSRNLLSEQTD